MGFTLDKVVPWGRSYDEYVAMFDLTSSDLKLRVIGCGDGPAGFNAELTRRGGTVVSVGSNEEEPQRLCLDCYLVY
jgi:hypothetical protein